MHASATVPPKWMLFWCHRETLRILKHLFASAVQAWFWFSLSWKQVWSTLLHLNSFPWAWSKDLLRNPTKGVAQNPLKRVLFPCCQWALDQVLPPQDWSYTETSSGVSAVASFWVQTEPPLISALCCHTAPECYKRHSLKKQAEVSGVTVCFSVITVTSINNRIVFKIPHLCTYYSPHSHRTHTHTQMEKHPLLQYQQVNWVCYLHLISFLKTAAERQAAGC